MMRNLSVTLAGLLFLAGCSFAPLRISVRNVVLQGGDTGGDICYVRVQDSAPVDFRHATYRADATYEAALLASDIRIRIYGRATVPNDAGSDDRFCTSSTGGNTPLSETITLEPAKTREIEIGRDVYSDDLAELITQSSYYLGATVSGGSLVGSDSIVLENGTISVYF